MQFVDLPDFFTEGKTTDEALHNAAEVLFAMLGWRLDEGPAIPAPGIKVKGTHYVGLVLSLE